MFLLWKGKVEILAIIIDSRTLNENLRMHEDITSEINRQTQAIRQQISVISDLKGKLESMFTAPTFDAGLKSLEQINNTLTTLYRLIEKHVLVAIRKLKDSPLDNVFAWIGAIADVVGILDALKIGIMEVVGAKIKSGAETLYIIALYTKDFIVAIGKTIKKLGAKAGKWAILTGAMIANKIQALILKGVYLGGLLVALGKTTGSLIKQTIKWGILTGAKGANIIATKAATIAQVAWNIAAKAGAIAAKALGIGIKILTSPIGLVLLAIGALIAIGVLLHRNWDTIGAALGNIFRGIANGVISMANLVIRAIETIAKAALIPLNLIIRGINLIPGVNIPKLSISIPRIPKLATGAVIPPNSEFLAILGDQRSGTNIETPERLLRQIMREELGGSNRGDIYVTACAQIGEDEFRTATVKAVRSEEIRIGKPLLVG